MARKQSSAASALERVPLLSGMNDRARGRLAKTMKDRTFKQGREVVAEGRTGAGFFLIIEGHAVVTIGGEVIRTLGPGDYFGEMALLHGGPRSATVTAQTELTCLTISSWGFKAFVQEHPQVAWDMLQKLAERLRESSLS
jgi:CRP/FNR family transcriptional regulator, cyclic AMP receptor protein